MPNTNLHPFESHWLFPGISITYEIFGRNLTHPNFDLPEYLEKYNNVFRLLLTASSDGEIDSLYKSHINLIQWLSDPKPGIDPSNHIFATFEKLADPEGPYLALIESQASLLSDENLYELMRIISAISEDQSINPRYKQALPIAVILSKEEQRRTEKVEG